MGEQYALDFYFSWEDLESKVDREEVPGWFLEENELEEDDTLEYEDFVDLRYDQRQGLKKDGVELKEIYGILNDFLVNYYGEALEAGLLPPELDRDIRDHVEETLDKSATEPQIRGEISSYLDRYPTGYWIHIDDFREDVEVRVKEI
ncbi:MAG: hypothetical protein MUP63_02675 [Candidatus Nanohaloarchaeota archaeon QJJ-7]|nr:hypothetical protein [Candidatus Nanohaloarchaeota archaeon QJJ-7]